VTLSLRPDFWGLIAVAAAFASVVIVVFHIVKAASRGIQTYEEKYVSGAAKTLDAMYLTMSARQIMSLSMLAMLVVFILTAVTTMNIALAIVLGAIGFLLPIVAIRILKSRRDKKFGEQLVDGLIAMGNALRVGHSLPSSFDLLAREMENPMGQEMRLLTQELRLGVSLEAALQHLYARMPSEDLDILITSITISQEVGGNLAEIFDNIADTIRERHRIQGKISALTAQGKLQGFVVGMLPILIGIILNAWMPELFRPMYTQWLGMIMLAVIVLMETIGCYMIWRIVSVKM